MREGEGAELAEENRRLRERVAELEGAAGDEAAFLGSILAAAPVFILRTDSELRIRFVNHLQPGLTSEEVIGRHLYELIDPQHVAIARDCIEGVQARREVAFFATSGEGPHGTVADYETHVAPIAEPGGGVGLCLVSLDVTEHKRQQLALFESEQKLRIALDATGIGLWSWDLTTGAVEWDERMREMCGEPRSLSDYLTIVHEDDREHVERSGRVTFELGQFVAVPHRIVLPDGRVRWMITSGKLLHDESGKPTRMVGGQIDITEQRALEEQLHHAQKLEALGSLTAGIAHNFNNLLMVITPSLELLDGNIPERHAELLRDAKDAADRAADLVRQLMTFAGQRPTGRRPGQDVQSALRRVVRMCRRTFPRHIQLSDAIASDLPLIAGDPGAVEQVVLNVMLNARDAVLASGRSSPQIRFSAQVVEAEPPRGASQPNTRYLCIRVDDDGSGMAPEVRTRMFEPFFTTKEPAEGTGLGLATSYAIVRQHEGWIDCESTEGEGTSMRVYLPVGDGSTSGAPVANGRAASRKASILLIDDEEAIRRVISRVIVALGHSVVAAADLGEALAALGASPDIDIVLLDRSMPDAPGETLIAPLRRAAPKARIVYFTGQEVRSDERKLVDGVIHKPIDMEALREAIGKLLG